VRETIVGRKVNPEDILLPQGYRIEPFAEGLTVPINIMFDERGDLLVADAGVTDGNGKVLKKNGNRFEVVADGFKPPLTGINVYQGKIYVSHRGSITAIKTDGKKEDILSGLPSFGDHHNNRVVFGPDGKMYFGQGTATNSGVVGEDNSWVISHPFFHDFPGTTVTLAGQNFSSKNMLSTSDENVLTGAFSPYRVSTKPGATILGSQLASGSILRSNPDGSNLELVAWGLRNPFRIKFNREGRLFAANHGMDERGGRPVAESPDEFRLIEAGQWYGWPDYTGGYPVTNPAFKPEGKPQPQFLLATHPMRPKLPIANFPSHSATMGFDFNYDPSFGPAGNVYIAEFGSEAPTTAGGKPAPYVGHRISRIDLRSGRIYPFAMNKTGLAASQTGGGGFERPIDILFGESGELFVLDFGLSSEEHRQGYIPHTGMIWRITRA
jgi:glucose/arabinose dehydrogenase